MTIKQKDAVVNAVVEVLGSDFVPFETLVSEVITADQKQAVRELVLAGILDGGVAYTKDISDEPTVKKYVSGLVNNHFRKAKDLNGGSTYTPTGTGAARDDQLRELNKLLSTGDYETGSEQYASIQGAITSRKAELTAAKASKQAASAAAKVDMSVIPSHILDLLQS